METQNIVNLLEAYLLSQNQYLVSLTGIKESKSAQIPYTIIKFKYLCVDYEIKVFNPSFMILKVSGMTGIVCDSLKTMRKELDELINATKYFEDWDITT